MIAPTQVATDRHREVPASEQLNPRCIRWEGRLLRDPQAQETNGEVLSIRGRKSAQV